MSSHRRIVAIVLFGIVGLAVASGSAGAAEATSTASPAPPILIPPSLTPADFPPAALAIAEAERAFAADGVAKGVRESFIAWFADDGIGYGPHPERTREAFSKRPPAKERPPVTLDWEPVFVDVAASGDLGISTGPSVFSDQRPGGGPPGYGYYFSVWRRQADGSWRVENDLGTEMPAFPLTDLRLTTASVPSAPPPGAPPSGEVAKRELLDRDRALGRTIASVGYAAGLGAQLGPDARLHRGSHLPFVGPAAIREFLAGHDSRPSAEPIDGGVSRAGDLGYVYGRWEAAAAGERAAASGYYLRVWKRFSDGWKVIADLATVLPSAG